MISFGKQKNGHYLPMKLLILTWIGRLIALVFFILFFVLSIYALSDTVGRVNTISNTSQGEFNFAGTLDVGALVKRINASIQIETQDSKYCRSHQYDAAVVQYNQNDPIQVLCNMIQNYTTSYVFELSISPDQKYKNSKVQQIWLFNFNLKCAFHEDCSNANDTYYTLNMNNDYVNQDSVIVSEKQEQKLSTPGQVLSYRTIPLLLSTTQDIQSRNPEYENSVYFRSILDFQIKNSRDYLIELRMTVTDQKQLWAQMVVFPVSMATTIAQIGGYIAFYGGIVIILKLVYVVVFKFEVRKMVRDSKTGDQLIDSKDYREVFSYKEFLDMQIFIQRLKENKEVMGLLQSGSKQEADNRSSGEEDTEESIEVKIN